MSASCFQVCKPGTCRLHTRPSFRLPLPDGKRDYRYRRRPLPHLEPASTPAIASPLFTTTSRSVAPDFGIRYLQTSNYRLSKQQPAMAAENTQNWESKIQRNPHPDFKAVEASRPPFDTTKTFTYTQTPQPSWTFGAGSNHLSSQQGKEKSHRQIDPYSPTRPAHLNYKLLISAIVPRPIAFVSTISKDGRVTNLAPFSYFTVISHDPPLFIIGFASSLVNPDPTKAKDTLRQLDEVKECTINIISEHYLEAANSTAINAPYGVSEWDVSGLTPVYDCEHVKAPRVREAVFSIEGKLESLRGFESKSTPGKTSSTMAVIEGVKFWAREDAINEEGSLLDIGVLRPVSRLGGITYGRVTEGLELPRPDFVKDLGGSEGAAKLDKREVAN
ncbi:hypothetical protein QBC40DRAFT_277342 [Triangularia verruculosa]|uniref:Flavin reductase like domain-containing protein n=1 Tax=Triangularia verruculosa TaxID=2587418 RepID=A0AAN6XJK6_9PEZI|nr:hypothetical protein QBC40DRAFT_277342 [Triangularia verruculosa]